MMWKDESEFHTLVLNISYWRQIKKYVNLRKNTESENKIKNIDCTECKIGPNEKPEHLTIFCHQIVAETM